MQYKTITLELLKDRPQMYEQLRSQRKLLESLDFYSAQLKDSHEFWKDRLAQLRPGSDETQIASEALEIALQELVDSLPPASTTSEGDPSSPEATTASPPA